MRLYCDNKSAITLAHNPVQHDRIKNTEMDKHSIKEKLDSGLISQPYVSTQSQLADLLTKQQLWKNYILPKNGFWEVLNSWLFLMLFSKFHLRLAIYFYSVSYTIDTRSVYVETIPYSQEFVPKNKFSQFPKFVVGSLYTNLMYLIKQHIMDT